jgi:hypothetical protein
MIQTLTRMILDWNYCEVGRMIMNWGKILWFGMSMSGKDNYGLWMMSMNWKRWSWIGVDDYKLERLVIHAEGWIWKEEGDCESGKKRLNWEGFMYSLLIKCNSQHLPGLNGDSKESNRDNQFSCGGSTPQSLEYMWLSCTWWDDCWKMFVLRYACLLLIKDWLYLAQQWSFKGY